MEALAGNDLVVLARYMQILGGEFLRSLGCPVIDVHHPFLPAFAGADRVPVPSLPCSSAAVRARNI